MVDEIMKKPEHEQYHFGSQIHGLLYPDSTCLQEPISRPHKGRKKHNPTQREKSGWEHAEKHAGNVSNYEWLVIIL